mmetsp:Transcript_42876/g.104251  ORF Transcript_42876/g.104251 Transcript_42876/m.104251 type:complete len:83 (-) Transcript_42876:355-603(-)
MHSPRATSMRSPSVTSMLLEPPVFHNLDSSVEACNINLEGLLELVFAVSFEQFCHVLIVLDHAIIDRTRVKSQGSRNSLDSS